MGPIAQVLKIPLVITQQVGLPDAGQNFVEILIFGWPKLSPQFFFERCLTNFMVLFTVGLSQPLPLVVGFPL